MTMTKPKILYLILDYWFRYEGVLKTSRETCFFQALAYFEYKL